MGSKSEKLNTLLRFLNSKGNWGKDALDSISTYLENGNRHSVVVNPSKCSKLIYSEFCDHMANSGFTFKIDRKIGIWEHPKRNDIPIKEFKKMKEQLVNATETDTRPTIPQSQPDYYIPKPFEPVNTTHLPLRSKNKDIDEVLRLLSKKKNKKNQKHSLESIIGLESILGVAEPIREMYNESVYDLWELLEKEFDAQPEELKRISTFMKAIDMTGESITDFGSFFREGGAAFIDMASAFEDEIEKVLDTINKRKCNTFKKTNQEEPQPVVTFVSCAKIYAEFTVGELTSDGVKQKLLKNLILAHEQNRLSVDSMVVLNEGWLKEIIKEGETVLSNLMMDAMHSGFLTGNDVKWLSEYNNEFMSILLKMSRDPISLFSKDFMKNSNINGGFIETFFDFIKKHWAIIFAGMVVLYFVFINSSFYMGRDPASSLASVKQDFQMDNYLMTNTRDLENYKSAFLGSKYSNIIGFREEIQKKQDIAIKNANDVKEKIITAFTNINPTLKGTGLNFKKGHLDITKIKDVENARSLEITELKSQKSAIDILREEFQRVTAPLEVELEKSQALSKNFQDQIRKARQLQEKQDPSSKFVNENLEQKYVEAIEKIKFEESREAAIRICRDLIGQNLPSTIIVDDANLTINHACETIVDVAFRVRGNIIAGVKNSIQNFGEKTQFKEMERDNLRELIETTETNLDSIGRVFKTIEKDYVDFTKQVIYINVHGQAGKIVDLSFGSTSHNLTWNNNGYTEIPTELNKLKCADLVYGGDPIDGLSPGLYHLIDSVISSFRPRNAELQFLYSCGPLRVFSELLSVTSSAVMAWQMMFESTIGVTDAARLIIQTVVSVFNLMCVLANIRNFVRMWAITGSALSEIATRITTRLDMRIKRFTELGKSMNYSASAGFSNMFKFLIRFFDGNVWYSNIFAESFNSWINDGIIPGMPRSSLSGLGVSYFCGCAIATLVKAFFYNPNQSSVASSMFTGALTAAALNQMLYYMAGGLSWGAAITALFAWVTQINPFKKKIILNQKLHFLITLFTNPYVAHYKTLLKLYGSEERKIENMDSQLMRAEDSLAERLLSGVAVITSMTQNAFFLEYFYNNFFQYIGLNHVSDDLTAARGVSRTGWTGGYMKHDRPLRNKESLGLLITNEDKLMCDKFIEETRKLVEYKKKIEISTILSGFGDEWDNTLKLNDRWTQSLARVKVLLETLTKETGERKLLEENKEAVLQLLPEFFNNGKFIAPN